MTRQPMSEQIPKKNKHAVSVGFNGDRAVLVGVVYRAGTFGQGPSEGIAAMKLIDPPSLLAPQSEIDDFLRRYTTGRDKDDPEVNEAVAGVKSYPELLRERRDPTPADFAKIHVDNVAKAMLANKEKSSAPLRRAESGHHDATDHPETQSNPGGLGA